MYRFLLLFGFVISILPLAAQEQWNSSRIQHELEKLPVNGTVLYIAAHPDDENTRLISWLANEKKMRTAYLSLTRGDGGQNLIGNELGIKLGIIRTHELMEARKIDGGEQFFTRAFDFGFSKSPEETFMKWNRDSILSDMVFVIRLIQPDFIVTRFPPDKSYPTHGHHTASALLAVEAFEAAADPIRFPEHFAYGVKPASVKRIYYNASTWWNPDLPSLAAKNDSFFMVDVGGYSPLLGASYTELAGRSRSMHKSQGFGSSQTVGETIEYLKLIESREPIKHKDPFFLDQYYIANKQFASIFKKCVYNTDIKNFETYMTNLVMLKKWYHDRDTTPLFSYREKQVDEIIKQSLGLKFTLKAQKEEFVQGDQIPVEFSIVKRFQFPVQVIGLETKLGIESISSNISPTDMPFNQLLNYNLNLSLNPNYVSALPWLEKGLGGAMFNNSWNDGGIYPGTGQHVGLWVKVKILDQTFYYPVPVQYIYVDPVEGECQVPIVVKPNLELEPILDNKLLINASKGTIPVRLTLNGSVNGFFTQTTTGPFEIGLHPLRTDSLKIGESGLFQLPVQADYDFGLGKVELNHTQGLFRTEMISYPHIGRIQHCSQPEIQISRFNQSHNGKTRIAYLQGAGDEVNKYLEAAGYKITEVSLQQINENDLAQFDVLILGIRSINTLHFTEQHRKDLKQFVANGGNVIVQYVTNRGIDTKNFGPYPFQVGRERITEEDAAMKVLNPMEPVLNYPNKLDSLDYLGWVQERGLYFVQDYDSNYRPVFTGHDADEKDHDGILIIGDYGKGSFMYTGISFFRQLPAGVPGAYRILGNMIDYEPKASDKK